MPRVPELRLHLADEVTALWQLTEDELGRTGVDPPFWAFAWAGGQAVARHLLDAPQEVVGATVLDLATGSGLVALAALRAGAAAVTAVDVDPVSAAAVEENAAANELAAGLTVVVADLLAQTPPEVDLLVTGDVCYDRRMADRVVPWLRQAARQGTRVLLGDPGRAYLPATGLTRLATYDVPTTADLEGREVCPASVYEVAG